MPKATPPSVLTMDVNALTEEMQSAEAKVANETASLGTASKKKHKRSAYTAAIESSPSLAPVQHTHSPRPPSVTPSPRPISAMPSITDVADAVQDQINAAAEVARANADYVQDQINAAAEIARDNANFVTSEIDEAVVTGGNFLEDAFGGMTLDDDVIEPKVAVSSRQGSFDATSFQPIQTPQQQHQYSISAGDNNFQETPSPLDRINLTAHPSTLRASINTAKVIHTPLTTKPPYQHIF